MNTTINSHSFTQRTNNRMSKTRQAAFLNQRSALFPGNVFFLGSILLFILGGLVFALILGLILPQNTQAFGDALSDTNDTPVNDTPITITIQVEGFSESIPVLEAGKDFTAGQPVKSDPCFMVDDQGNQILAGLIEQKESEGYKLVWKTEQGESFDWFNTAVNESITVVGTFEQSDYTVRISFNDDKTQDLEVSMPKGSSFEQAYGSIPQQPSKTGYSFVRWVNSNDNSTFDFTAPVSASTTVYALFSISEPDKVVTVDADFDIPETLSGKCYIGATWGVHPAKFSISGFSGELEGCSGTGSCSLPSAAAPSYTWADYKATLADVNIEAGIVTYDVTITPPGAAKPDGPRNSLGLIGYQTVYFKAEIQKNFGGYIELQKTSSNPSLNEDNATYSLEGATFGIYNDEGSRVAQLVTNSEGKTDRSPLLPVGIYTIKEEYSPRGFASTEDKTVQITAGSVLTSNITNTPQSALVDLVLQKVDTETNANSPLGSAAFEGAQFKISYYDRYLTLPHMVKSATQAFETTQNDSFSKATSQFLSVGARDAWQVKRSWIFETDEHGNLRFAKDYLIEGDDFYYDDEGSIVLPLGTVIIEEVKAPEGYLPIEEPFVVTLAESGNDVHIEAWQTLQAVEQVKRGDLSFTKVREGSMERLAHVPFRITSKTTSESHILVTDENGMASTESSWTPHSQNTNAGTSSNDGIWFGNDTQGNIAPVDDSLGALPYDTYLIEEQPCSANEGMLPVAFEVTISRNNVTLDLGTVDNKPFTPEISGEVDKRQTLFVSNGLFSYTIDYRSTSPTWADEFTTTDIIVCAKENQAHLRAITTPVSFGDYDGKMNIWYKTNLSESKDTSQSTFDPESVNACSSNPYNPDNPNNERLFNFEGWQLWKQDVSTLESSLLFTEELELEEGEYVTELAFEHGRVEEGFSTLNQDDTQWDRRDRYTEDDTLENLFDSSAFTVWDENTCKQVAEVAKHKATLPSTDTRYAPAILYMEATEEMLASKGIELWNDARIDIYRNLELHDEDEDSVVQTTTQNPTQSTTEKSNNPVEEIISKLPKTGDIPTGTVLAVIALAIAAALALVIGIRGAKNKEE